MAVDSMVLDEADGPAAAEIWAKLGPNTGELLAKAFSEQAAKKARLCP